MALIRVRDKDGNYIDIPALRGESAYEVAVRNGYTGTEAEWVESTNLPNSETLKKLGDSGGTLTYNGNPVGGGINIKFKDFDLVGWNEGKAVVDNYLRQSSVEFVVFENIPEYTMIIDFGITYKGKYYSSSDLIKSGIISLLDIIRINPVLTYDSDVEGYVAVVIGCQSITRELYSTVSSEDEVSMLRLFYI